MTLGSAAADTLSVLLPTPDETAFLAACLLSGADARQGWMRWRARRSPSEESVRRDLVATRTFLPLLARSAMRNELGIERGLLPYLRAAALREELRATRYREIAAESLNALARAGTTPFVVRGAALAATVYENWALRHCHDLDLMLRKEELATAIHALVRLGCAAIAPLPERPADALLLHDSGLRIALHTRPFAVRYYDASIERVTHPPRVITIAGVAASTLSPEATLVHLLGHATYSTSRNNLHWVADAWHLVAHHPDLDWEEVRSRIEEYRLMLPVSVLLGYLADFGVPARAPTLLQLARSAAHAGWAAEDVALGAALAGVRGQVRILWRATPSWRGRVRLACWGVAPSLAYLRSTYPGAPAGRLLTGYLRRPAGFVAGVIRRHRASASGARSPDVRR